MERRRCQRKRKATRTGSENARPRTAPRSRRPHALWKLSAREPGDPGGASALRKQGGGRGTHKGKLFMYAAGKSDHCVVPEKALNKHREGGRRNWREGDGSSRTTLENEKGSLSCAA